MLMIKELVPTNLELNIKAYIPPGPVLSQLDPVGVCDHIRVYLILTFKCGNTVTIDFGKTRSHDSNTSTQERVLNCPVDTESSSEYLKFIKNGRGMQGAVRMYRVQLFSVKHAVFLFLYSYYSSFSTHFCPLDISEIPCSIPSTCGSPLQSFNELYIVRWNIDREQVCVN
jgi:hypothetical protein